MYKGKINKIQFCRQPCKSSVTDPEGPCALMPKGRVLSVHIGRCSAHSQPAGRARLPGRNKGPKCEVGWGVVLGWVT